MMDDRKLKDAINAAMEAHNALKKARQAERDAAVEEVDAKYHDRLVAMATAANEAKRALADHIDANSSHPWAGKKVFRMTRPPYSAHVWGKDTRPDVRENGIVEIRTQQSPFAEVGKYRRPAFGEAFVRKLKKDGTPAIDFYTPAVLTSDPLAGWQLADDLP